MNWLALVSIVSAAVAVSFGAIGPALAEGRAVAAAMDSIARRPESANTISRTLFVGLAMIETMAIYCLVIALLLLFANPKSPELPPACLRKGFHIRLFEGWTPLGQELAPRPLRSAPSPWLVTQRTLFALCNTLRGRRFPGSGSV
jgi:F-type H+-transporting ATPase subunit c